MDSCEHTVATIIYSVERTFSHWLQGHLDRNNWTQSELARRAGLARGTVSNVLNGERRVGEETALALAKALHLPPEEVFRAAGLLPPTNRDDPLAEEARHIMHNLPADRREQAIRYLRFLAQDRD